MFIFSSKILYFLWYSDLQELEKSDSGELQLGDEDQLFRTQITPYFEEVYYCYYGEEEESADPGGLELEENVERNRIPDFIKIVFGILGAYHNPSS